MAGAIKLNNLNHINIGAPPELVEDTRRFYVDVIGLRAGPLPGRADFPVYWLYLGDQPVIHLIGRPLDPPVPNPRPRDTGWIDHIAFSCTDHRAARARLDEIGVPYQFNSFPQAGIVQFLVHDPVGIKIELNFMGEEADD
jgi:catechol 2,3-dioxygenase-like lactoylglutathione lyase family enzyme